MTLDSTTIIDYNYDDFLVGINKIVTDIWRSDFEPDYIVGIVRGGSVPAVYLSHKLKIPVQMLHWNTRDNVDWNGNESNTWIPEDINNGKKVLLVDDIVDGGDTIREILEDWESSIFGTLNRENIKIASLVYNVAQDIEVDFYDFAIDRNEDSRWIVFSWES